MKWLLLLLPLAILAVLLAGILAGEDDGPEADDGPSDPTGPGRLRIEIGGDPMPGHEELPGPRDGDGGSAGGSGGGVGGDAREDGVDRHRVEEGETLIGLAREYYGDPDRWRDIQRANGLSSERIEVGQVLVIPR